ncbi:MAG: 50S ribosomal protein L25/general stress protein Ctc [Pseudomonadota bacterium]
MAKTIELEVTRRDGTGKGAARSARREGLVPGVIYGGGKDPETINVKHNVLLKQLKAGSFLARLVKVKIDDGEPQTTICRAVQRDIVRDLPTHVDFLRLSERSRINLAIPVDFTNHEASPGIKKGGVLTVVRSEIELRVRASAIPDKVTVDLTGVQIGDTIKISNVELPDGAMPTITDRDFMIANISAPRALVADDDADEDAGGADEAAEAPAAEDSAE